MKHVFDVTVEWKLKGKAEKWMPDHSVIVAASAHSATDAAIKKVRENFVEPLSGVRLVSVVRGAIVDQIL